VIELHHVNLQAFAGGGEFYTRTLTRALLEAGARVTLYAHPANRVWDGLPDVVRVASEAELLARLPRARSVVLTQGPLLPRTVASLAAAHRLVAFAHMPITEGRSAEGFRGARLVVTVSEYCIGLLRRAGIAQVYGEPLYGVADLERGASGAVLARSPYVWDRRKFRDRLLGALDPFLDPARMRPEFVRLPGITLGVVSLLSPIKQLPRLFSILAPILARHAAVRLEIFGSGGYAQVRDLKRALAPIAGRTRLWGQQENVAAIYPSLDYLMTGLPEKEALGLNALEAQACGTPVLAPNAPPFTETVIDRATGFLYRDPREDGGADFARHIDAIAAGRPRPDPRAATEHLAKFGFPALVARAQRLLDRLSQLE
jgi:glycosyltransferase involved in cell wall biosynthesis